MSDAEQTVQQAVPEDDDARPFSRAEYHNFRIGVEKGKIRLWKKRQAQACRRLMATIDELDAQMRQRAEQFQGLKAVLASIAASTNGGQVMLPKKLVDQMIRTGIELEISEGINPNDLEKYVRIRAFKPGGGGNNGNGTGPKPPQPTPNIQVARR